uniref:Uncharacterized protein n=1 Tax=Avena sativa TaxID=4498 RepID=A0ACD5WT71_AVESA
MAAAAVKPSLPPTPPPPPSRLVVAVLVFVRFVLASMLAFGRGLLFAAKALPYLCFATSWVFSAASAATVVARHACREGSGPLVFLEALKSAALQASLCVFFLFLALVAVMLCGLCLVSLVAAVSGSGPEFKKSAFGAITQESAQESIKLPRAAVLGLLTDLPFILLTVAGILVMVLSSHVEGSTSQGEIIGSMIMDVGSFGIHAISCLVIIPALALDIWRNDRSDRKAGLPVEDC